MDARFADIEFGLVWDEAQKAFDVTLRFARGGLDHLDHPKEPIHIDLQKLGELVNNEDDYAAALTGMVFNSESTRQFYSHATAAATAVPVHFRLHLDGPARFHEVRWESLGVPFPALPRPTSRNMLLPRYLGGRDGRPIQPESTHGP